MVRMWVKRLSVIDHGKDTWIRTNQEGSQTTTETSVEEIPRERVERRIRERFQPGVKTMNDVWQAKQARRKI